jgi:hypothetical protein
MEWTMEDVDKLVEIILKKGIKDGDLDEFIELDARDIQIYRAGILQGMANMGILAEHAMEKEKRNE